MLVVLTSAIWQTGLPALAHSVPLPYSQYNILSLKDGRFIMDTNVYVTAENLSKYFATLDTNTNELIDENESGVFFQSLKNLIRIEYREKLFTPLSVQYVSALKDTQDLAYPFLQFTTDFGEMTMSDTYEEMKISHKYRPFGKEYQEIHFEFNNTGIFADNLQYPDEFTHVALVKKSVGVSIADLDKAILERGSTNPYINPKSDQQLGQVSKSTTPEKSQTNPTPIFPMQWLWGFGGVVIILILFFIYKRIPKKHTI
jgi:hypothetical protein